MITALTNSWDISRKYERSSFFRWKDGGPEKSNESLKFAWIESANLKIKTLFISKASEFSVGIILRRDVYDFRSQKMPLYSPKAIILLVIL